MNVPWNGSFNHGRPTLSDSLSPHPPCWVFMRARERVAKYHELRLVREEAPADRISCFQASGFSDTSLSSW